MYIYYNLQPFEIEDTPVTKLINKTDPDSGAVFRYDLRTQTMHLVDKDFTLTKEWYFKYLEFLNNIVTRGYSSLAEMSPAQGMIGAGFIPLVVEPSFSIGQIEQPVKNILDAKNIPYKETFPVSFATKGSFYNKEMKDLWVHRMDFGAKNPRMVTTFSLWKELDLDGIAGNSSWLSD